VNSISMYAPSSRSNGSDPSVKYSGGEPLMTGQWYWIKLYSMDHWNIIGHLGGKNRDSRSREFFISHANRLKLLPQK